MFILTAVIHVAGTGSAAAIQFLSTGTVESYAIPTSGYYAFVLAGAQGGIGDAGIGGGGALISGKIYFDQGLSLSILAGGGGSSSPNGDSAGGGGGMSFIAVGDNPIIIAGGGAGAAWFFGSSGQDASIGSSGDGEGGSGLGSGAGWYGDGGVGLQPTFDMGGGGLSGPTFAGGLPNVAYSDGTPLPEGTEHPPYLYTTSGGVGGFGGGGGGGFNCGGSGAGFTGGDGCGNAGSSFISDTALDVTAIAGGNKGPTFLRYGYFNSASENGFVSIVLSAVPEPSTWLMLLSGFAFVGIALRRQMRTNRRRLSGTR